MSAPLSDTALYQVALTLTSSRELEAMLAQCLQAFVKELRAEAGVIFRIQTSAIGDLSINRAASVSDARHEEDLQMALAHLEQEGPLPVELPGHCGDINLMAIPGFGALGMVTKPYDTPSNLLVGLDPLLAALGRSCATCIHIQEEARHEESRIMADILAARTRELNARTRELDAALQRTQEVSRLKEELLASMSHELRTPLNAVLGLSEALKEEIYGPLSGEQRESIQVIESSGQRLLGLLTDMMDFVRIGAGQMQTNFSVFDAMQTIQVAGRREREAIANKELALSYGSDGAEMEVFSDAGICQRIVGELLRNAIKFSDVGGKVHISLSHDVHKDTVSITVSDSGCGIAAEKLSRLFEPFVQLQGGLKRRHGGTGLGLALSSRLATLIGAELSVESVRGEGSHFTLIIGRQGPKQLEVFGDLACPSSYTLNLWLRDAGLSHLIAWRSVEQRPGLTAAQADSPEHQAVLDQELEEIIPRSQGFTLTRPVRRSNTKMAHAVLKHLELEMPERLIDARAKLFEAIWVRGEDISALESVKACLSDFSLETFHPGERELAGLKQDDTAWREDPDPQLPTVVSPRRGVRHRGLGHRALLQQFLNTELGFLGSEDTP